MKRSKKYLLFAQQTCRLIKTYKNLIKQNQNLTESEQNKLFIEILQANYDECFSTKKS